MSPAWFHVPELREGDRLARLPPAEGHHARRVKRLNAGDALTVFNGRGLWAEARLGSDPDPAGCAVEIVRTHFTAREPPAVHLVAALPKGDRMHIMLNMVTQLGISTFAPLRCHHTVVQPGSRHRARAARVFVEACKQSRNPWLPLWRDPVVAGAAPGTAAPLFFAHPGGRPATTLVQEAAELTVLVGPEAGFTDGEAEALVGLGGCPISLGTGILRVETAAVALVAMTRLLGPSPVNPDAESLS